MWSSLLPSKSVHRSKLSSGSSVHIWQSSDTERLWSLSRPTFCSEIKMRSCSSFLPFFRPRSMASLMALSSMPDARARLRSFEIGYRFSSSTRSAWSCSRTSLWMNEKFSE